MSGPDLTLRRTLEQIKHCAQEALSVAEHDEDLEHAKNDLTHARGLIDVALERIAKAHRLPPRRPT